MATTEQLILKILADTKDIRSKLDKTTQNIGKVGKKTKQVADQSKGFLSSIKAGWLAIGVAAVGVFRTIKKAVDIAKESAKFNQSVEAMETQFDVSSKVILTKLREVSDGTVANADLVIAANRVMALNVTKDVGEMAKLMEIARVRGRAMGVDTTKAFSDLVLGIGRGSALILDNLGIITTGWDEQAKAAGRSMDTQFILERVLEDGNKLLEKTGELVLSDAEIYDAFSVTISNITLRLGSFISKGITPFIEGLNNLFSSTTEVDDITTSLLVTYEEYDRLLKKLTTSAEGLSEAEQQVFEQRSLELQIEIIDAVTKLNELYDDQGERIKTLFISTEKLKNKIKENNKTLENQIILRTNATAELLKLRKIEQKSIDDGETILDLSGNLRRLRADIAEEESKIVETRRVEKVLLKDNKSLLELIQGDEGDREKLVNSLRVIYEKFPDLLNLQFIKSKEIRDMITSQNDELGKRPKPKPIIDEDITDELDKILSTIKKIDAIKFKKKKIDIVTEEFEQRFQKLGLSIASGFSNALKSDTGREGAEAITNSLNSLLSQAGWWGSIVAAFLNMFQRKTPRQIAKFTRDLGESTGDILEKIFTGLVSFLANPANIALLIGGIFIGIANAITQIFTKEFWVNAFSGATDALDVIVTQEALIEEVQDKIDKSNLSLREQKKLWEDLLKKVAQEGTTQEIIDQIVEKLDGLQDALDEVADAAAQAAIDAILLRLKRFNQQVQLGNKTLEEQIEIYKQILIELKAAGANEDELFTVQLGLNNLINQYNQQLEQANQLLEKQTVTWNKIINALNSLSVAEFAELVESLDIRPEDIGLQPEETANMNALIRLLNKETIEGLEFRLKLLEAILIKLKEQGSDIGNIIQAENEILSVQEQLNNLREEETEIFEEQVDLTDTIKKNQLDALNALRGFVSEFFGLRDVPQFMIDPLLDQLDLAKLGLEVGGLNKKLALANLDFTNLLPPIEIDNIPSVAGFDTLNSLIEALQSPSTNLTENNINVGDVTSITNGGDGDESLAMDMIGVFRKWGFEI